MNEPVTIAIVDDHKSTRELIADLIRDESRFECVGVFPDAAAAMKDIPALKPSIVLMDINMPGKNGIECVGELKPLMPDTDFVILTVYDQTDYIFKALSNGAVGYLLKRSIVSELIPLLLLSGKAVSAYHQALVLPVYPVWQKCQLRWYR